MSALPPALRPWASQLSLFPEELALHLGPYVARLSAALGSLRPRNETDGGEPQGYDGLTRRGTYDRLLVSEWLWALESPDELVRRAAFGELSFLKPAFRQPQGARRTVALLDAGPDQLGAPRIAHLALLIVLSRRAQAAGAAFSWGVLQSDPNNGAFSEVSAVTLKSWLDSRSLESPSHERLAAWREALSLDAEREDAWLVGDSRLGRLPMASGLSRVEVAEVLAPGVRQLTVDVRPASRASRSVVLDLPPPDTSVRLLRDPLQKPRAPAVAPPTRLEAPLRSFSFSADGKRLMLFREDGSVGAMAIPHSIRATVPRARRVTPNPGDVVVGAGWRHNGGLVLLAKRGDAYVLYGKLRSTWRGKPDSEAFHFEKRPVEVAPPPPGTAPGRLLSCEDANGNERLLLAGLEDSLFLVEEDPASRRVGLHLVARGVTAAAEVDRKVVYVTRAMPASPGMESAGGWLCVVEKDSVRHLPLGAEGSDAYFGHMGGPAHPDAGLLAVRQEPGSWRLFRSGGPAEVHLSTDMSVIGVGTCRSAPGEPGLLALGEDRRTLWLISPENRYQVSVTWDGVVHAEASHGLPVLGWMLKGGGLVLSNLREGGILYQALPGAAG